MNARFSATLAVGLALSALITGCTIHTYSGAAYPGTVFRSEPPYEHRPTASRTRTTEGPQHADAITTHHKPTDSAKPTDPARPITSHAGTAQTKPSKDRDVVVGLKPEKPTTDRRHRRSFNERLAELVEQKKEELAREKQTRAKRDARMQRALDATVEQQMND